ncbi:retrovirus-related pol polyprotein from transposon TNT 1-94, partial [Tanacetum coccineum]
VESSHSFRRSTSKDIKSKNSILKNTKSSSTYVWKTLDSACLDSNKSNTKTSNVCQTNACISNSKTVKACVNVVKDGSNIVCISYGNDVFLNSHEKCVARPSLSRKSSVKRALFTSPLAAKSTNLGATSIVTKSRLSVAKTPTATSKVIQLVLWIVDSGCSKHMTGNLQLLRNFIEKFIGTVRFGNDHFTAITGYGDYVQVNLTICHVYYVEGLGHNLFSVGQFCDGDLEMAASSPVCLMSRATSTKSWLWHRPLSHLNFGTINQLTSNDLVDGLPKLKYTKDHLCLACEHGKSKKASLLPKLVPSTESKLELLYMDLCGPMRVESINGKKYILMIVDDYSRYTWEYFLRTKDKAPDMIIDFVNQVQRNLKAQILTIRTDNRTEFKNEKLRSFYAKLGINRSIVHTRHNKTPYELIHGRKPNIQYFYVFGSLCYPTNDRDDPGKMKPKADIEYYEMSSQEVSDDSAANTTDNDHTSSSSSIVVDQDDAPLVVSSSDEQVSTVPNFPVMNEVADECVQEDVANFKGNMFHNAPQTPEFEVAESSSTYQDPLNMHQFHQQHRSTNRWTKNHPIEQVIGDPSKPTMTRKRLKTDTKLCMYALTISTIKPKNIKEAMLDHSWIESMQDVLNQFKRLDVWELVECPVGRNIIVVKWI